MVNNCLAKRDTKTCSGVAGLLILNVPLASQRAFVLSIHHCLPSPSLPGPYYYWPGNPVKNSAALAAILNGGIAAGFSSWNDETKSVLSGFAGLLVMSRVA
ncbi:hypothetical protein [Candidatus Spongiihabitans sp.]|uniref:hypothetical protein n=1 Tax=Candidatus Spongiihabitans sp. TaxID=3101308 RepID=UPI003C7EA07C